MDLKFFILIFTLFLLSLFYLFKYKNSLFLIKFNIKILTFKNTLKNKNFHMLKIELPYPSKRVFSTETVRIDFLTQK